MSDIIWGVSSGSYSDYRVLCLCPSEEDAKIICANYNGRHNDGYQDALVESWPICDRTAGAVPVLSMSVIILDDGTTGDASEHVNTEWPWGSFWGSLSTVTWRWARYRGKGSDRGTLWVRGTDFERVRKVFSDRRAEILAIDALRLREEVSG